MVDEVRLFFDGGCRPNPGLIEIAVVIRGQTHLAQGVGIGDNNTAEWQALLLAAEIARGAGVARPLFIGDSATVIHQARGEWPCRSAELRAMLDAFEVATRGFAGVRLRRVPRSRNLAGIALAQAHR